MAESVAALNIATAVIELVSFATKVLSRIQAFHTDLEDVPRPFQEIKTVLPLLLITLQKSQGDAERANTNENSTILLPVVKGCRFQVEQLDKIFDKLLPVKKDSTWTRGTKALSSVIQEKKIQRVLCTLRDYIQVLTYYQTSQISLSATEPTSQKKALFTVPFERDENFIDRVDTFRTIWALFSSHRRVAISGIGGIGKSQIAIEFCYRFREQHPNGNVFWIHAGTFMRLQQGFRDIAHRLALPGWGKPTTDAIQVVNYWLTGEESGHWLMVFDGLDSLNILPGNSENSNKGVEQGISSNTSVFPYNANGNVLITTRNRKVAERIAGRESSIAVPRMTALEAKALLLSRIQVDETAVTPALQSLLESLDHLPLAINQCGAFISQNGIEISSYKDLLLAMESELERVLSEDQGDHRRNGWSESSVMGTWGCSITLIEEQHPLAAEMLSLMAMLDRQAIPIQLLTAISNNMYDLNTALGTLKAFSLVTAERGGQYYNLHRLVQIATCKWLSQRGKDLEWQEKALHVVADAFPGVSFDTLAASEILLPHAQAVVQYEFAKDICRKNLANILEKKGWFDFSQGRYEIAEQDTKHATELRENLLGAEHPDTLRVKGNLSSIHRKRDNLKATEILKS